MDSNSSVKPRMDSNSSIKDLLECPVCMTSMYPPIHQCRNGHTICFRCKTRINNICPACREEVGNIRCIALEKLAELVDIPCKFHESGCQGFFYYPNRVSHERICTFRPYNCPYSQCSGTGDITFLAAHLKETHRASMLDGSIFEQIYKIPNPVKITNTMSHISIINCFGHQFYIEFETFILGIDPAFMAFVGIMGDETEAKKFRYSLEVGGNERVMTWQGIPMSIRESNKTIRDTLDGLIIQKKNLALFFSGDGQELKLIVKGRIWRERTEYIS